MNDKLIKLAKYLNKNSFYKELKHLIKIAVEDEVIFPEEYYQHIDIVNYGKKDWIDRIKYLENTGKAIGFEKEDFEKVYSHLDSIIEYSKIHPIYDKLKRSYLERHPEFEKYLIENQDILRKLNTLLNKTETSNSKPSEFLESEGWNQARELSEMTLTHPRLLDSFNKQYHKSEYETNPDNFSGLPTLFKINYLISELFSDYQEEDLYMWVFNKEDKRMPFENAYNNNPKKYSDLLKLLSFASGVNFDKSHLTSLGSGAFGDKPLHKIERKMSEIGRTRHIENVQFNAESERFSHEVLLKADGESRNIITLKQGHYKPLNLYMEHALAPHKTSYLDIKLQGDIAESLIGANLFNEFMDRIIRKAYDDGKFFIPFRTSKFREKGMNSLLLSGVESEDDIEYIVDNYIKDIFLETYQTLFPKYSHPY